MIGRQEDSEFEAIIGKILSQMQNECLGVWHEW
jgi:hypothetical protein